MGGKIQLDAANAGLSIVLHAAVLLSAGAIFLCYRDHASVQGCSVLLLAIPAHGILRSLVDGFDLRAQILEHLVALDPNSPFFVVTRAPLVCVLAGPEIERTRCALENGERRHDRLFPRVDENQGYLHP
jgi:hypothetical protein